MKAHVLYLMFAVEFFCGLIVGAGGLAFLQVRHIVNLGIEEAQTCTFELLDSPASMLRYEYPSTHQTPN